MLGHELLSLSGSLRLLRLFHHRFHLLEALLHWLWSDILRRVGCGNGECHECGGGKKTVAFHN